LGQEHDELSHVSLERKLAPAEIIIERLIWVCRMLQRERRRTCQAGSRGGCHWLYFHHLGPTSDSLASVGRGSG
jgi:hypothetical protein